jgi:transposase-like protein
MKKRKRSKKMGTNLRTRVKPKTDKMLQDMIKKHVLENGGTKAFNGQEFIQELVKNTFQALLQAEMSEHLGYDKNDPQGKNSGNTRNGTDSKMIRGDFGQIEIEVPRDRNSSFEPQIVKKRESNVGMFSEKVISLYARGMTTREIEDHLKEMYDIEVSPTFISRATEALEGEITEWQNRPLERLYPILYVDGMRVPVRSGDGGKGSQVINKVVYTVLGVGISGTQTVLGLWISETESASFWLKVCNDLKARGVEDLLIACVDGLTGLPDAIRAVFPDTDVQGCVVHQIRNATKFVSWANRKQFCADMRLIYTAPTIEAAELALDNLDKKWGARYPMSIQSWRRNWDILTTFFKYPVELRRIIYTTNAIESLHSQMRKNTSNRKVFPNDQAALKLLYLNVKNFTNKWTKKQNWDIVMNQLSIMFADRINFDALDGARY